MSTINNVSYSSPKNINLKQGVLRFAVTKSSNPHNASSYGLYVNSSGQLIFSSLGSTTVLGSGGGSGVPSWENIFANDSTFTITPDSVFTIAGNRSTATGVLKLTNAAGGSGPVLEISNAGSGVDILGTSSTWQVTKAGVASFAGVSISGTASALATTGAAVWTIKDNDSASLSIDASGATGLILIDSTNGAELVSFGKNIQVTDGKATFISTSNTVSNLLVTNNTVTTFGADANSSGVAVFRSTSLTTGSLLQLQLTEGTLNGGFYLTARDVTGGVNVFTLGEDGAIVQAGVGGANVQTITAGDFLMSDGSITVTDADNAASLSITNSTATTASVVVFAGAGVFTGSTTTSFMTLTPSGLTTGTAFYIAAAALTTGKVINIAATAATDGILFTITGGGANMTATGNLAKLDMGAATVGNGLVLSTTGVYTGTGLITLTANSATTGVIQQITANGITTGTLLDLSSSGVIVTTGEVLNITANSATTSTGLLRMSATGLTDGWLMALTGGGANVTASGGGINLSLGAATVGTGIAIASTGVYTGTTGMLAITANSATTGILAKISGTGVTSGTILHLAATEATLTTGLYINCYDGAASDFSVGKYGATIIAGSAAGTAALTLTAGDIVATSGHIVLTAGSIKAAPQAIVSANTAISVVNMTTTINTTGGATTHTMADGVSGQFKTITCITYAGDAVITPSNLAAGTTITLNAAGDSWTGVFYGTEWFTIAVSGTAAVA